MKKVTSSIALLLAICFIGCQKDLTMQEAVQPPQSIDESHYYEPSKELLASYDALRNPSALSTRNACNWIEIPAGSVDALAQAVNNACAGGVIYLKTGVHTETKPITITKSIILIGQAGAILKMKSKLATLTAAGTIITAPSLHFFNAPRSAVLDLDIQPLDSDGSTAILLENSNESAVIRSKITNFQMGILIEKSDRVAIMKNTIIGSKAWQTGGDFTGEAITIINGKSAYISDNDLSNSVFGVWPCDKWGTLERNNTHDNFIGVILCNVPAGSYVMPSGRGAGAEFPSTGYKLRNNNSTDNQYIGYLVIDGANNNIIENNNAARNATYDMELTTDSYRFGFLTPKSYNNVVNAGIYPNIRIKDCGLNNTVTGGIRINTTTDPCN